MGEMTKSVSEIDTLAPVVGECAIEIAVVEEHLAEEEGELVVVAVELERFLEHLHPAIGIEWPIPSGGPILSDKDRRQPRLAELPAWFP